MANLTDTFKDIFLAGVGALAIGAEKSQEVIDQLVQKGQITVDQGKEMTDELKGRAKEATGKTRDEIIKAYLATLSKDERDAFAANIADLASQVDGDEQLQKEQDEEIEAASKGK